MKPRKSSISKSRDSARSSTLDLMSRNRDSSSLPFHLQFQTMEYEEVEKSLWHAFDVLDKSAQAQNTRTSQVHKTKLKVFTNNLGQILGVPHAETIWDKVSEDRVDFTRFLSIINSNLLVGLDKLGGGDAPVKAQIDELCWMLCEKSYRQRIASFGGSTPHQDGDQNAVYTEISDVSAPEETFNNSTFSTTDSFKLWKIFNFLCERGDDGKVLHPLRTDVEEADRMAAEICLTIGLPTPKPQINTRNCDASFLLDFTDFVNVIVEKVRQSEEDLSVFSPGIAEVHSHIVADVVRKGMMVKFGNKVTTWKERWFVLTASALRYFVSSEEKDLKGTIILCHECSIKSYPDKPGGKHYRFKLQTPNKQYELSAPSLKARNEWISDLKRVIQSIGTSKESLQKQAVKQRKREREERRRLTAEEEMRRCAEREQLLEREKQLEEERQQRKFALDQVEEREQQLQLERQKRAEEEEKRREETNKLLEEKRKEIEEEKSRFAEIEARLKAEREALLSQGKEALDAEREKREEAEAKLKEEEAQLEAERKRLRELEEERTHLQAMVEEERALKRDEEIVRNLQSKILEEEFAKREELERLQAEQGQQLLKEQMSRQELEAAHRAQEDALREAQEQLEALTMERLEADKNLQDAAEKLRSAEFERQKMEERMKLKEMTSSSKLAKPLAIPEPNPFVTHRGPGAFTEADFSKSTVNGGESHQNDHEESVVAETKSPSSLQAV
ncbi:switch-associated protein 70 [Plakobranchus ocellatus]|uniref:Switch-associated protein 70 n=1 Tax=Plakobranchus ocellatus TaxID=259542 RepID=A0AAV3ZWG9_9GAST|nr:switch-associated protein 70 [Plakobranchus ocellatus]